MSLVRNCAVALAAVLGLGAAKPAPAPAPLAYEVSPEIDAGRLVALDVSLKLNAGPDGRLRLELPDGSAGVTELWRNLRDLKVEGATSVATPNPAERLIEAQPGAPLTVRYRVVSAFDHDPTSREMETYSPLIRPTRFWIYGEALFAALKDSEDGAATFRWTGAPAGFGFASDLEHARGLPMPMRDLLESVLVGGPDLTIYSRTLRGAPVRVAMAGRFDFAPEAFVDEASRVIAGERAFWGGKEGPFLVAMTPLGAVPNSISIRGEGRGDAFAIQGGVNSPLDMLKAILAHEYFHTWNPGRLGGMSDGDAERAEYWFSEGFTDFYARRLSLRSGVFSLEDFVREWNTGLREYAASPVRTAPNARIVSDFWKDGEVQKLPYRRGAMLAAIWDQQLRTRSGGKVGMDDVVKAMRARAAALGPRSPKAAQLFVVTIRGLGLEVKDDVARVVETGAPVLLPADVFGGCLTVATREIPMFETGYAVADRGGERVFVKVNPESPAYAAGLREGMIYIRRDAGEPGDSTTPYKLRVRDGGAERVVSFMPAGKAMETLQQVELPKTLTPVARLACTHAVAAAR